MTNYRVTWDMELVARSPREAAEQARAMLENPASYVRTFDVAAEPTTIDLDGAKFEAAVECSDATIVALGPRQVAAVLAGLRLLQEAGAELPERIADIACNGGTQKTLDTEEIDRLCEEINLGGGRCRAAGPDAHVVGTGKPIVCPDCGGDVVDMDIGWRAVSREDADNSAELQEYQCEDENCALSFWVGTGETRRRAE